MLCTLGTVLIRAGEVTARVDRTIRDVRTVAACTAAGLTLEQVAGLQLAFPTFTEGVSIAAQKVCRAIGIGPFPQVWSCLGDEE